MLPTFVIGLREGLEAALIVGIVAAFLRKQGRSDLLRQMAYGVAAAVLICLGGGIALELYSRDLPQRQQEGLETVIGILAVGMVTYMVIWMKENSRGLKAQLESLAAEALGTTGSRACTAMVVMAFLAVLREGFETVVFLLAAFNESDSGSSAVVGAFLGIAVAVALGYAIYRGGVRINLSKFFRATGLVLVLVAAGLVVSALHTAHEAGWLDLGQHRMMDLSWLVQPGSVLSSLLTGMLGVQPYPVLVEVLGWLLYAIPVGVFVAWPQGRAVPLRSLRLGLAGAAVVGLALAGVLAASMPSTGSGSPLTRAGSISAQVVSHRGGDVVVRTQSQDPLTHAIGDLRSYTLAHATSTTVAGLPADGYTTTLSTPACGPARMSTTALARLNGGHLPIGVRASTSTVAVRYVDHRVLTVTVEPRTSTVLGVRWQQSRRVLVPGPFGQEITVDRPLARSTYTLPANASAAAVDQAHSVSDHRATRDHRLALAWLFGILGGAGAAGLLLSLRRRPSLDPRADRVADPANTLIKT